MCGVGSTETLLFYSSFMSALKPCLKEVIPAFSQTCEDIPAHFLGTFPILSNPVSQTVIIKTVKIQVHFLVSDV